MHLAKSIWPSVQSCTRIKMDVRERQHPLIDRFERTLTAALDTSLPGNAAIEELFYDRSTSLPKTNGADTPTIG